MPLTFLAHQAPVLPVARRWPERVDGVALAVGSAAPDFAYVLAGSRFSLWAHDFPNLVLFCVPATVVVSWLLVRVIAPVAFDHLPQAEPFRLRDYRGLATHRFRLVVTPLCAFAGALSHAALDQLTHGYGWFARNISWYDDKLGDVAGHRVTVFQAVQGASHIVGSALCLWLLARYGKQRWMAERAAAVPLVVPTRASSVALATATAMGALAGAVSAVDAGDATAVLRIAAGAFAGLLVGSLAARRLAARPAPAMAR